jgi:hypothetical protein
VNNLQRGRAGARSVRLADAQAINPRSVVVNLCERGPAARRPVGFARRSRAATPPPPIRHAPAGTPAACVSREARPRAPDPDGAGSVVKHACCCSFCECVLPLTWHPAAPHPLQAACLSSRPRPGLCARRLFFQAAAEGASGALGWTGTHD